MKDELKEIASKHDVSAVIKRQGTLRAGVIAINNTEVGNRFLKRYAAVVKKKNEWKKAKNLERLVDDGPTWEIWMANQYYFNYLCMKEMKDEINFGDLGDRYCDGCFTDTGVIWAAKNTLKKSPVYLNELKKYF